MFGAADSASLDISGNLTLEFWVKIPSQPGNSTLIGKSTGWASERSYEFAYYDSGSGVYKMQAIVFASPGTPTNFCYSQLTYTMPLNTWVHVAVVVKVANAAATKFEFFINGVSQGNGSGVDVGSGCTSIYNSNSVCGIGGYPSHGSPTGQTEMIAKFSLVRVWSVARTQAEIAANMCNVIGSMTNLKAEWTLNNTLADNSGNSNTLTNYGSVTFGIDTPSVCAVIAVVGGLLLALV